MENETAQSLEKNDVKTFSPEHTLWLILIPAEKQMKTQLLHVSN